MYSFKSRRLRILILSLEITVILITFLPGFNRDRILQPEENQGKKVNLFAFQGKLPSLSLMKLRHICSLR